MNRLGMSKADKIWFVIITFSLLGLAWFVMRVMGMFGGFISFF
jgi:hypothetical protein